MFKQNSEAKQLPSYEKLKIKDHKAQGSRRVEMDGLFTSHVPYLILSKEEEHTASSS